MKKDRYENGNTDQSTGHKNKPAHLTWAIDAKQYAHYLENSGLTQKEKEEYLQTLWEIICEWVMLGFHIHPLQQIPENPCGKDFEQSAQYGFLTQDMLKSGDHNTKEENQDSAESKEQPQEKGV